MRTNQGRPAAQPERLAAAEMAGGRRARCLAGFGTAAFLLPRQTLAVALCCAALTANASGTDSAGRQHLGNASFLDATYLIDVQQGSRLSVAIDGLRGSAMELAGGTSQSFERWYKTRWTDTSIAWMTQANENLGVVFGFSTGERGKKYSIRPSFKLGFVVQASTGRNAFLSLRATTILGGELREKSCSADYGEIGGVQEVHCRLAASTLPPAETLKYLLREKPHNRNQLAVMWNWRF